MELTLLPLIDDAKCFAMVRKLRWPEGVSCPHCESMRVTQRGMNETQPDRQRYLCGDCGRSFDDLTDTIFAGHHQPLRVWLLCLYFLGRASRGGQKKGWLGRRRRLKGDRGRSTLAKEKPPIFGMIQRTGQVVLRMLAKVQQATIGPILKATISPGTTVYTDEYDIYSRLTDWGYQHRTVNHGRKEYAREEDGDGFHEVHVHTLEGCWSLLRSWLRPHRGISQEKLPLYVGFFQFVHNARKRGKALLESLVATLLTKPPRNAG